MSFLRIETTRMFETDAPLPDVVRAARAWPEEDPTLAVAGYSDAAGESRLTITRGTSALSRGVTLDVTMIADSTGSPTRIRCVARQAFGLNVWSNKRFIRLFAVRLRARLDMDVIRLEGPGAIAAFHAVDAREAAE